MSADPLIPRAVAIGVAAAGVVSFVVGAVLAWDGNAKRDDIEAAAQDGTRRYDPADGNYRGLQQAGAACMIGGAVVTAGGAALFLVGGRRSDAGGTGAALGFGIAPGGIRISGDF